MFLRTPEGEWRPMGGLSLRDLVNLIKTASLAHSEIFKCYRDAKQELARASEAEA